jgi:hypothetical protein
MKKRRIVLLMIYGGFSKRSNREQVKKQLKIILKAIYVYDKYFSSNKED